MEDFAGSGADGVLIEDFFNGGEALAFVGDFFGRSEDGGGFDAESLGGEGLEFFAKDDGVGAAGFHELHFLRREGLGDVFEFFTVLVELFVLGVDGEEGAGIDRVGLFEDGVAFCVLHGVAFGVFLFDPVLEVEADAAGDINGGEENGGNAIGACDDGGEVDEGDVGAGRFTSPEGGVVHAGHAGGADTHGAFFRDEHDALVGVDFL